MPTPTRRLVTVGLILMVGGVVLGRWTHSLSYLIAGVGLVMIGAALTNTPQSFIYPDAARAEASAWRRRIKHLDRVRMRDGLEGQFNPEDLAVLEAGATEWERLGNAVGARVWEAQPELSGAAVGAGNRLMLSLLGNALRLPGYAEIAPAATIDELSRLAVAVERASRAIESYPRASGLSGNVPLGDAFADVEALRDRIERLRGYSADSASMAAKSR